MAFEELTPKQEAFAKAYIENGGNGAEAYRHAHPAAKKWKPAAVHVKASQMLALDKVQVRIRDLRTKVAERHEISIGSITEMLKEDRKLARELGQPAASISAAMGIAKLHGLIVEKRQNTNVNIDANQLSDAELEDIASGRSEELAAPTASPLVTH